MNKWHLTKVQSDNYRRPSWMQYPIPKESRYAMILHKSFLTCSATWLAIPMKLVFDIISTPLKEQTDKGEIYILPCQGHYLNPEYFSEESPLEYQDKSRTNNISSCKYYIDKHAEVVIASPDTVIFLMMVQMYPCDITFITGKGNLKRNIPVQPLYNTFRHISASSILGFHDQTGSDMSGRVAGRTKEWCFRVFMACDDNILNDLKCLGHRYLSQEEYDQLERFVCQLCKSYIKVNELRWFLYSNRAAEGESLPTMTDSLTLHIQRAHYVAIILRKAGESQSAPLVSGRLSLGVWHDQTSLCSSKMFESCSYDELGKVWMQTWTQEDM